MTIQLIAEPFFAIIKNDKSVVKAIHPYNTHENTSTQGALIKSSVSKPCGQNYKP
jgi:hypothetical protein